MLKKYTNQIYWTIYFPKIKAHLHRIETRLKQVSILICEMQSSPSSGPIARWPR